MPLGAHFNRFIQPEDRYSVDAAFQEAEAKGASVGAHCATVIDLTRSSRYYDARRWQELGVRYVKV